MSGLKIAVLISGGGSNLQALIDHIAKGQIKGEISLVISSSLDAYGLQRATLAGIKTAVIDRKSYPDKELRDQRLLQALLNQKIDLVVLAGYLQILSPEMIQAYPNRIINIHPSLLPSFSGKGYYGMKVHEAAIQRGVKISGATVHFVNEETDGGPIILQEPLVVEAEDDAQGLQKKVLELEHQILPQAVKLFVEGKLTVKENKVYIKA